MKLDIAARLELVEERIEAACKRSGRKRQEISLMGVTKMHPPEIAEAAWNAGIRLFGESRVQEGIAKYQKFWETHSPGDTGGITGLHFIGSLQRNKAKTAAGFFDCIQSVDRDSLIYELGTLTEGRENPLMLMLELHTGEDTKAGFPDTESLFRAAEKVLEFPGMCPIGLMTMAPFTGDKNAIRRSFRQLAAAKDEMKRRFPGNWSCLSMGMSNDYEIAIEEGSTLIRIGTALFGERET